MIFLKNLSDKIKLAVKNNHSVQHILCYLILWQFSDIENALKTSIKKPLSIEIFLSAYLEIPPCEVLKMLESLSDFKNISNDKNALNACLSFKT